MTCRANKWQSGDLLISLFTLKGIEKFSVGGPVEHPMGSPRILPMPEAPQHPLRLRPQGPRDTQTAPAEGTGGPDSPQPQAGIQLTWISLQAGSGSGGGPVLALRAATWGCFPGSWVGG